MTRRLIDRAALQALAEGIFDGEFFVRLKPAVSEHQWMN